MQYGKTGRGIAWLALHHKAEHQPVCARLGLHEAWDTAGSSNWSIDME